MARIEDLIKDIADPSLRNQIAGEVGKLKAQKKFGLVFEEHLPEIVADPYLDYPEHFWVRLQKLCRLQHSVLQLNCGGTMIGFPWRKERQQHCVQPLKQM